MILKNLNMKKLTYVLILLLLPLMQSCFYKFNAISLSPDVKTVSIENFQNMSLLAVPTLASTFSEALRDKFTRQAGKLTQVQSDGDIQFSGEITNYTDSPTAVTGDQVASQNRLTITVKVKFVNVIEPEKSFEKTFSSYDDYPGTASIEQYRDQLITNITDQIIENIFNESVATW